MRPLIFKYVLVLLMLSVLLGHQQIVSAQRALQDFFYRKERPFYTFNNGQSRKQKIGPVEAKSWEYYKKTFISNDGRVMDHQRGGITTSEGQAYAMSRALIMSDKVTFDKTYNWAKYNLQHKNDKLFAWLWGQKNVGARGKIKYGVIDSNGATDAGVEIATSLILASQRWKRASYMQDAISLLNDIWEKETILIKGERILISGVNQNKTEIIEINPSYFLIYSFRIFAQVDKAHDWQKLVDSSYRLTNHCLDNLACGLPPDFFYINKKTGLITFHKDKSDFSYDAVRVFYRFYVDYSLTKDPRAKKLLSRSNFFIDRWKLENKFYTNYKQSGDLKDYDEAIGSIEILLPVIRIYDKYLASEIYKQRIRAKYNNKGYWGDPMDYYAQNLVWFGNWLYQNEKNVWVFKY